MIAVANPFATFKIPGMFISTNNELEWACHQGILHQLQVNVHFPLKILINICMFKNKVYESLEINEQVVQKHSSNMLAKQ